MPQRLYRDFGFSVQDRSPSVENLPVHLPNESVVLFDPSNADRALNPSTATKVTAYFDKNVEAISASEILYPYFPVHYTWYSKTKVRKKRQLSERM